MGLRRVMVREIDMIECSDLRFERGRGRQALTIRASATKRATMMNHRRSACLSTRVF